MYQAGYLRLQPGYRRDFMAVEGSWDTVITPTMRASLVRLLRTFKPAKHNSESFVAIGSGYEVAHSAREFLALAAEQTASDD
jgi:hypothetical protein